MKIAIIGAGMTGAYLYRLLQSRRHTIDLFDKPAETRCEIAPCAWGTSRGFQELVAASALDPSKYIYKHFDYLVMNGLKVKADLMTINKKELIKDLLQDAEINYFQFQDGPYDRIIDATGVSRALLPPIQNDIILSCTQVRLKTRTTSDHQVRLDHKGYAWCFPLSDNEYHIGCGSLKMDPHEFIKGLSWIRDNKPEKIQCTCSGRIRLTSPFYSQPFVIQSKAPEIWGVGEAIGCVSPFSGDGIVPGMKSVQLLLKWWDNPSGYSKAILKEFSWMKKERPVIHKLKVEKALGLNDAWVLKRNSRRLGIRVGLNRGAILLKRLG